MSPSAAAPSPPSPPPLPPPPPSCLSRSLFFLVSRYRLALFVAPLSAAVVGARAAVWQSPSSGFATLSAQLEPSVVSGFISAAIFVTALLVSGVMADYKEAERFPCELEAAFSSLYAQARHASRLKSFDAAPALVALHGLLLTAARYFDSSATYVEAAAALAAHEDALMLELDSRGAAGTASAQLAALRAKLARAHIVRETSFLPPAYTLVDSLVAIVVLLLVLTRQASDVTGYVNAAVFSFLFFYLGALVRDIDDPLDYHGRFHERCVLTEARRQMQARYALADANSVDFSLLFVDFARLLRADLRARGVDVEALARAPPPPPALAPPPQPPSLDKQAAL